MSRISSIEMRVLKLLSLLQSMESLRVSGERISISNVVEAPGEGSEFGVCGTFTGRQLFEAAFGDSKCANESSSLCENVGSGVELASSLKVRVPYWAGLGAKSGARQ